VGCEALYLCEWFAQAVDFSPPVIPTVHFQTSICYGKNGTGTRDSPGTSTHLCQISSTTAQIGPLQITKPHIFKSYPRNERMLNCDSLEGKDM